MTPRGSAASRWETSSPPAARTAEVGRTEAIAPSSSPPESVPLTPDQLVRDLVQAAVPDGAQIQTYDGLHCLLDAEGVMHHQCAAWLPEDMAWQKFQGFFRQWPTKSISRLPSGLRARISLNTSLWQWLSGSPPTLEVEIRWQKPAGTARLTEISVQLSCPGDRRKKGSRVLEEVGPGILQSLRGYLMAGAENRSHPRFAYPHSLKFSTTICTDVNQAVECRGRDISLGGLRFKAPVAPESSHIYVYLPVPGAAAPVAVRARVRQVVPDTPGFLVGAQFELGPMIQERRVLLLEKDESEADRLSSLLAEVTALSWELQPVDQLEAGLEALASGGIDVVLLNLSMVQGREREFLHRMHEQAPTVPVIVLANPEQKTIAQQAVLDGAANYLMKAQMDSTQLARTLHGAVERQRARQYRELENERERMAAELEKGRQKEHYLAYHDALTGLPNRSLFYDRLQQALALANRQNTQAAVMFLDLDGFKRINDTLGHSAGDDLLKSVAERLQQCVRKSDTVARLGGDEFTIILNNIAGPEGAAQVAEKVLASLARPVVVSDQELCVTTSIGISVFPGNGTDVETLVKQADLAMYRAKSQGKNDYQIYHEAMNDAAAGGLALENELRKGIERGELVLHYQPQVNLRTGAVVGVEALVRWQHPKRGLLSPAQFISLAEETGLIVPLGEWVLRTACARNVAWQAAGHDPLRVTVNLSPRQFREKNLAETVARILAETGLAPERLGVEITESSAMQDVDFTIKTLKVLKDTGIQVLIDDFGTGYSSLNYLKHLPIDGLKIEQSFIKGIPHDRGDVAITTAVIGLAHNLDLKVIAEHVDTEEQLAFLKSLDCDELQSYLFSRPLPEEALTELLAARRAAERPEASVSE